MAKILILGTWLAEPAQAREAISRANGDDLSFGGLSGQLEITGSRIAIERHWIANDRTWRHGMPRSVVDGRIAEHSDSLFVVTDEPDNG